MCAVDAATALLDGGASVNAGDQSGSTALHYAVRYARRSLLWLWWLYLPRVLRWIGSHQAARMHRLGTEGERCLELLLTRGADVNVPGASFRTPLMDAIACMHAAPRRPWPGD
jgi:ankyrin repeat protein